MPDGRTPRASAPQLGRQCSAPLFDLPDHLEEPVRTLALEQIAARSTLNGFKEMLVADRDGENHDLDLRHFRLDQARGGQSIAARHLDVHEDEIGVENAGLIERPHAI